MRLVGGIGRLGAAALPAHLPELGMRPGTGQRTCGLAHDGGPLAAGTQASVGPAFGVGDSAGEDGWRWCRC